MPFKKGEKRVASAGRRAGTPNKSSVRDVYAMAEKAGVEPFEVLLGLCNHRDPAISLNAAKECAKYMYTQKRVTEVSGPGGSPIEVESSANKELVETFKAMLHTKLSERKE